MIKKNRHVKFKRAQNEGTYSLADPSTDLTVAQGSKIGVSTHIAKDHTKDRDLAVKSARNSRGSRYVTLRISWRNVRQF